MYDNALVMSSRCIIQCICFVFVISIIIPRSTSTSCLSQLIGTKAITHDIMVSVASAKPSEKVLTQLLATFSGTQPDYMDQRMDLHRLCPLNFCLQTCCFVQSMTEIVHVWMCLQELRVQCSATRWRPHMWELSPSKSYGKTVWRV